MPSIAVLFEYVSFESFSTIIVLPSTLSLTDLLRQGKGIEEEEGVWQGRGKGEKMTKGKKVRGRRNRGRW